MGIFTKKTDAAKEGSAPGTALIATQDAALKTVTVQDTSTGQAHLVKGYVLTSMGEQYELSSEMRAFIVATSGGQIFVAREASDTPRVMSRIEQLAMKMEGTPTVVEVDATTVGEIYRIANAHEAQTTERKSTDESRMQREVLGIIDNAARAGASDVHIIVNQDKAVVRFRIDGLLRDVDTIRPNHAFDMLAAAFAMADESDATYQKKSYQGARISSLTRPLPVGVQSLRLQINPLANEGRVAFIRLLYSNDSKATTVETLGYNSKQIALIKTMAARPVGINVISGPTGSGKSTTLKAVLERLIEQRRREINVVTIEDPPEYVIKDAQQHPVNNAKTQEERREAFVAAISAGMRSDPDVLMIGEIRDLASANLGVEGALSGHPVYASLHANTAMDIPTRLRDMGVDSYKVYDSTIFAALLGQRLSPKLCPHCRKSYEDSVAKGEVDDLVVKRVAKMWSITPHQLHGRPIYLPNRDGCPKCRNGYKGRCVVSEIILPDETFMELMRHERKREARAHWFRELDGLDMLGSAWMRCLQGKMSPYDIENWVTLMAPTEGLDTALENWADMIDEDM